MLPHVLECGQCQLPPRLLVPSSIFPKLAERVQPRRDGQHAQDGEDQVDAGQCVDLGVGHGEVGVGGVVRHVRGAERGAAVAQLILAYH